MFKSIIQFIKGKWSPLKFSKTRKAKMIFPAEFTGYDPRVALYLAKLSEWAYPYGNALSPDYESNQDFQADMRDKKKKAAAWGFKNFNFVYSEDLKILAFILRNGHNTVICFRGTIINITSNWKIDLQARLIPMASFGGVHKGFSAALDSIWEGIKSHISAHKSQRIWLTGHSLGGALAILAGARILTEFKRSPNIIINGLYVFAAPRVGDCDFADSFKNTYLDQRSFVFANYNDVITVLPPGIQKISEYMNAGNILFINREGVINPITDLSEFKIIRQFLTGYFKDQFINGFKKDKIVHDWQTFKHFFTEVFTEIKPTVSTHTKKSEHWSRLEHFFMKELPILETRFNTKGGTKGEQLGQDRLSKMIRELFFELFIESNQYVIESHDITTYIKSLKNVMA